MNEQILLELYKNVLEEEHFSIKMHHERVSFYSGFVSAIFAAVAVGFLQASEWYHYIIISAGPIIAYYVAENAIEGCSRDYLRFIETITTRAKIEQALGLTLKAPAPSSEPERYWSDEPLVPLRHIESRKKHETSKDFVREYSEKGISKIVKKLFHVIQWVSIAMFAIAMSLAIWLLFKAI